MFEKKSSVPNEVNAQHISLLHMMPGYMHNLINDDIFLLIHTHTHAFCVIIKSMIHHSDPPEADKNTLTPSILELAAVILTFFWYHLGGKGTGMHPKLPRLGGPNLPLRPLFAALLLKRPSRWGSLWWVVKGKNLGTRGVWRWLL